MGILNRLGYVLTNKTDPEILKLKMDLKKELLKIKREQVQIRKRQLEFNINESSRLIRIRDILMLSDDFISYISKQRDSDVIELEKLEKDGKGYDPHNSIGVEGSVPKSQKLKI